MTEMYIMLRHCDICHMCHIGRDKPEKQRYDMRDGMHVHIRYIYKAGINQQESRHGNIQVHRMNSLNLLLPSYTFVHIYFSLQHITHIQVPTSNHIQYVGIFISMKEAQPGPCMN